MEFRVRPPDYITLIGKKDVLAVSMRSPQGSTTLDQLRSFNDLLNRNNAPHRLDSDSLVHELMGLNSIGK